MKNCDFFQTAKERNFIEYIAKKIARFNKKYYKFNMFFLLLNEHENMFDETLFLNILIKEMFK